MTKQFDFSNVDNIKLFRAALNIKLTELAKELGISARIKGSISYTAAGLNARVECANIVTSAAGKVVDPRLAKAAADWARFAILDGLNETWLGKSFVDKGRALKIVGYMPSRRKYPVLVQNEVGKLHVMGTETILSRMRAVGESA